MAESVEYVAFKKFSVYCNEKIKNSIAFGWKIKFNSWKRNYFER